MRNRLRILTVASLVLTGSQAFAQADSTVRSQTPMLDYETPKRYIVNDVTVSGIKYLDLQMVASMAGLVKGDTIMIPSDYVSSTLTKMWNQGIYSDVQILTQPVGDSVNVEIVLKERPSVYNWNIEGVRKGQMKELLETLPSVSFSEKKAFTIPKWACGSKTTRRWKTS